MEWGDQPENDRRLLSIEEFVFGFIVALLVILAELRWG